MFSCSDSFMFFIVLVLKNGQLVLKFYKIDIARGVGHFECFNPLPLFVPEIQLYVEINLKYSLKILKFHFQRNIHHIDV